MIPESIVIDGTQRGGRFLIEVDRVILLLPGIPFRFFAILGIQRASEQNDGWVKGKVLYRPRDLLPRYMYKLRNDVRRGRPDLLNWDVAENDQFNRQGQRGKYRLVADPGTIEVVAENVGRFEDHDVTEMLEKYLAVRIARLK